MFGIDGNAIDMATIVCGLLAVLIRPWRIKQLTGKWSWDRGKSVLDFLNGASLVPFAVMAMSAFWTKLLQEVIQAKASLALAGTIGLLFLIGEALAAGSEHKPSADSNGGK